MFGARKRMNLNIVNESSTSEAGIYVGVYD
jgi:hypothetical protein